MHLCFSFSDQFDPPAFCLLPSTFYRLPPLALIFSRSPLSDKKTTSSSFYSVLGSPVPRRKILASSEQGSDRGEIFSSLVVSAMTLFGRGTEKVDLVKSTQHSLFWLDHTGHSRSWCDGVSRKRYIRREKGAVGAVELLRHRSHPSQTGDTVCHRHRRRQNSSYEYTSKPRPLGSRIHITLRTLPP